MSKEDDDINKSLKHFVDILKSSDIPTPKLHDNKSDGVPDIGKIISALISGDATIRKIELEPKDKPNADEQIKNIKGFIEAGLPDFKVGDIVSPNTYGIGRYKDAIEAPYIIDEIYNGVHFDDDGDRVHGSICTTKNNGKAIVSRPVDFRYFSKKSGE